MNGFFHKPASLQSRPSWKLIFFFSCFAFCLPGLSGLYGEQSPVEPEAMLKVPLKNAAPYIRLEKNWYFKPGDDPAYKNPEYPTLDWARIPITPYWKIHPEFLDYQGTAWYRLPIINENLSQTKDLALLLPFHYRGAQIFFNGQLLRETREVDSNGRFPRIPGKPELIKIPVGFWRPGLNILAVRTASLDGGGGFRNFAYLGSNQALGEYLIRNTMWYTGLSLISIFISFYFLLLFLRRKLDKYYLHFSGLSLALGVFLMGYGGYAFFFYDHYLVEIIFSYYSGLLMVPMLLNFLHTFLELKKRIFGLVLTYIYYGLLIAISFEYLASGGISFFNRYLFDFFVSMTMVVIAYALILNYRALKLKRNYAAYIFLGLLFLSVCMAVSVLHFLGFIQFPQALGEGYFLMTLAFANVLARRFTDVHEQLEKAHAELKVVDQLKDEFLANTSHELRTPLHGMIGIAESMMDGATGPLEHEQIRNLSLIVNSGLRLSSLVNDLLDMSRLKYGNVALSLQPVDLRQVSEIVLAISGGLVSRKNLDLKNQVPENLPSARGDENRLIQIMQNLIGNAIKFTEAGSITVSAQRLETPESGGSFLEVTVADTGIGIPEHRQKQIFNSFEQMDASIERDYGGTGLGLSIVKSLVELHGGAIRVESSPGQGSRFIFTVPESEQKAPEVTSTLRKLNSIQYESEEFDVQLDIARNTGRLLTIMVVDDEAVNRQVLTNHLSLWNFKVREASRGQEAIDQVEKNGKPDLILLDVMMPKMSGYDVCIRLREKYSSSDLPIILLTAKNQVKDLIHGFKSGANDYLAKPFSKNELLARINSHVENAILYRTLEHKVEVRTVELKIARDLARESRSILEKEIRLARKIQEYLLPRTVPEAIGVEIGWKYIPMLDVGGDFFDLYFDEKLNQLGFFICDVSGHGVPAAFLASMVKMSLRNWGDYLKYPARNLEYIKSTLADKTAGNTITACMGYIDFENNRAGIARAGHPPAIRLRVDGRVEFIKPRGRIITEISYVDVRAEEQTLELEEGDLLIFYTDGITEASNREKVMLEEERFVNLLKKHRSENLDVFCEKIHEGVMEFCGGEDLQDDFTLLAIRYGKAGVGGQPVVEKTLT